MLAEGSQTALYDAGFDMLYARTSLINYRMYMQEALLWQICMTHIVVSLLR